MNKRAVEEQPTACQRQRVDIWTFPVLVDMTAEEALAAAEAEGLPLIQSAACSSGYKHVCCVHDNKARPYDLHVKGKHGGNFATAEEAALTYSRHIGREAAEAEAASGRGVDITAEEVIAAAEAEGLPLIRSAASSSGYKHVLYHQKGKVRPYSLHVEGKYLGSFATAEEAALTYSRLLGREAAEAEAAKASRVDMTAEEALAAAEAEGLPLVRSAANSSGYKHVSCHHVRKVRPFFLTRVGGSLGSFATAEEAALTYSRHIGREVAEAEATSGRAARADCADMTAEEAIAAAEAEGLPLIRTDGSATGFRHVTLNGLRFRLKASGLQSASFATAEEAALTYSRHLGREAAEVEAATERISGRAARADRADMTAEEALAAAETEGLPLIRSAASSSGYRHVCCHHEGTVRPYSLQVEGKHLGCFATAEEAALTYSRRLGREATEAELAKSVEQTGAKAMEERERERRAAKAKEERERERRAAKKAAREAKAREKEAAKAEFEEHKRQQAARQELMAQRQRAMLQEAAERQRQRTAGSSRPGPSAPPCPTPPAAATATPSAPPGDVPTAALIKQVLRDRASAHLCLGVDFFAPRDVVRKRYLALVLRLHPDKVAHPRAAEAFAAVEAAFRRLCGG